MPDTINVQFNQEEANALQKILAKYAIFIGSSPGLDFDFQVKAVTSAFEKIDEHIHVYTDWCDKGDECSYYKRHPDRLKHKNMKDAHDNP